MISIDDLEFEFEFEFECEDNEFKTLAAWNLVHGTDCAAGHQQRAAKAETRPKT